MKNYIETRQKYKQGQRIYCFLAVLVFFVGLALAYSNYTKDVSERLQYISEIYNSVSRLETNSDVEKSMKNTIIIFCEVMTAMDKADKFYPTINILAVSLLLSSLLFFQSLNFYSFVRFLDENNSE